MSRYISLCLAALIAAAGFSPSPAAPARDAMLAPLEDGFVGAWRRADPERLADNFTPEGDLVTPTGAHAAGRAAIAAFYGRVFEAGYKGSAVAFTPRLERRIAPGAAIIDGEWRITGIRGPQGAPVGEEHGLAAAVLVKTAAGWRIAALREQTSGSKLEL